MTPSVATLLEDPEVVAVAEALGLAPEDYAEMVQERIRSPDREPQLSLAVDDVPGVSVASVLAWVEDKRRAAPGDTFGRGGTLRRPWG